MTSHRDYEHEKDWEWLRNDSKYADALRFEPVEGEGNLSEEKFEMVVTARWKSKVSLHFLPSILDKVNAADFLVDQDESGGW